MSDDQTRIDALRKGINRSKEEGYVAIRVADLRWLLDQAESDRSEALNSTDFKGEPDEPEQR